MARRLSALVVLLTAWSAAAQTTGSITAVRVYRGQALVTRELRFPAALGPQSYLVTELPAMVEPASLYASGGPGLVVRGVNFRATATSDEPNPEVRALDDQIRQVQTEIAGLQAEIDVVSRREQFLDKMEEFVAPTAQAELTHGVLNADSLMQLARFSFEQRQEIAQTRLQLTQQQETANERLQQLQRDRAKLTGTGRTLYEAVVFLEAEQAGEASFELSYMVNGVGWQPAYIARLDGDRRQLELEYHAVVTQTTGEDWNDVALTLSTTHPSMVADPPILSPLYIAVGPPAPADAERDRAENYAAARQQLQDEIRAGQAATRPGRGGAAGLAGAPGPAGGGFGGGVALPETGGEEAVLSANILAARLQNLELSASEDVIARAARQQADFGALAADYEMPGRSTLPSRADPQMLMISGLGLEAGFYYTAVPLLSDFVHQAAESVNNTDYALLPGAYNAYTGTQFAGRGVLPMTARGQTLRLGFGTQTQLRVGRELKEKRTELRGGNKILTYVYEMRLQNFMNQPARVQVWERLPQPPDDQVRVTLIDEGPPLSTDPVYLAEERPRGLLRWDVEVPAGATRQNAMTFQYSFSLEFDRNFDVSELPEHSVERMRNEFENMLRNRAR